MSSMPTPRDTALPSTAGRESLSNTGTEWQSIWPEACLNPRRAATGKRLVALLLIETDALRSVQAPSRGCTNHRSTI